MFKNLFKRSWLSVTRKLSRTIIIGLVLFAMGSLMLATIIIKSAVNESTEYAKETLGATVSLQADMSKLREERKSSDDKDFDPSKMFERPAVTKSTADKIADSDYVKDYTYSISATADADSLTAVESKGPSMGDNKGGSFGNFGGKTDDSSETTTGDFTISGINGYAYIDGVSSGTLTISDGTYFNEGDTDKIMVSADLAEANNLSVGDKITFKNVYTNKTAQLTIIGIYDSSLNFSNANTIYMNIDTAAKFLSNDDYNKGDFDVESVSYTMNNAEDIEAFISEINENYPELAEANITASEDTRVYDQMVGPIESVGSFATTILIIVTIASIIVITLIVTINVKDRRYEMGVLLSLGAKKINIIGQIFVEIAMIGAVAFGLSACVATALADAMGQTILEAQVANTTENFGRPSGGPSGDMSIPSDFKGEMPDDNQNYSIDIHAQPIDFLLLFVCGYGVIILALLVPSINILRYQPKQILQGKE